MAATAPPSERVDDSHELHIVLASYLVFFVIQGLILVLSEFYPQTVRLTLLGFSLAYPFVLAVEWSVWPFVIAWLCFVVTAGYVVSLAWQDKNDLAARWIFGYFAIVHRLSFIIGVMGGLGVLLFVVAVLFDEILVRLLNRSFQMIAMGGFFGVIQRDFAVVCRDRIQLRSTRKWKSQSNACVVCGSALRDLETRKDALGRVWTIEKCGHECHEECARGWAIIGKRGVSPCCSERMDTGALTASNPWQNGRAVQSWTDILDMLRLGLVFFPIMFVLHRYM